VADLQVGAFSFPLFLPSSHSPSHSLFSSLQTYGTLLVMGNRDARGREKKKPKKETPKVIQAPPRRDTHQITTPVPAKSPAENQ